MGGTKWNKGGTSEGTYGPVDWDHFAIQILPSVSESVTKVGLELLGQLKIKTPSQYF